MRRLLILFVLIFSVWTYSGKSDENALYLYNWYDYIPDHIIEQFSKETGIAVFYSTYDSNEEMFEILSITNGNGYDLIVPSGYFVSLMMEKGLLRKIDTNKLTNYKNLNENRLGTNPDYGVPYFWGATLLLVNSNVVDPQTITSWNDLLKPEFKDNIFIINDLRDIFSIALSSLGYSINTQNRDEVREAYLWLRRLLPSVKYFSSEDITSKILNEDIAAAVMYNGEALKIIEEKPEYVAIYPKEGVPLWLDCLAIPKGAKHVSNAYKFIDFILREDINKEITEYVLYSTPNKAAFKLLDKKFQNNKTINPTEKEIGDSEFLISVGKALPIYERYWKMLHED